MSIDTWDQEMSNFVNNANTADTTTPATRGSVLVNKTDPVYADEILPFDVTITCANEYGQMATMTIFGVELLNEGSGFSIDNVVTEKAYTFIARSISKFKPITSENNTGFIYYSYESGLGGQAEGK